MTSLAEYLEQKGMERGIYQGERQGSQKATMTIAKNLLKNGASIKLIKDSTGLSEEEIKQLR